MREHQHLGTRRQAGVITEIPRSPALAEVWPEVAGRLVALLRRRGVDRETSEDIVQEVATRALVHGVRFDDAADLSRWAATVARNLAVDHARAQRRFIEEPPEERPATVELASLVEHRIALAAVREELGRFAAHERAAVLSQLSGPSAGNRRDDVRLAVQRHRARARLKQLLKGLVGVLGGLWGGRRLARGGSNGAGLSAAALPVAAVLTVLGVVLLPRPDAPPSPPGTLVPAAQSPSGKSDPDTSLAPRAPAAGGAGHDMAHPALPSSLPPALPAAPRRVGSGDPYAPLYREVRADAPAVQFMALRVEPKKEDDPIACVDGTLKPEGTCLHKDEPSARLSGPGKPPAEALGGLGNTSGNQR